MTATQSDPVSPRDAPRCPICLHAVADPATVAGCSHSFCLPCLRQWAASRPRPACPLCKVEIAALHRADGSEEALPSPPPPAPDDAPPDLGCLDHAFFAEEARRLRRRVAAAQHGIAASRGRRPAHAATAQDLGALAVGLDALIRELDTENGVPFDPETMLKELYDMETALAAAGEGGGAAGAAPRRLSAADAAAASDDEAGAYGYSDSEEDEDEEEQLARAMDRAGLGRRRSSARGSRGSLAHAASTSSLASNASRK